MGQYCAIYLLSLKPEAVNPNPNSLAGPFASLTAMISANWGDLPLGRAIYLHEALT